jgi:hypothetical protein
MTTPPRVIWLLKVVVFTGLDAIVFSGHDRKEIAGLG